nr:MAG TPA: hypothetical protein [Caudoviricetes sp.]
MCKVWLGQMVVISGLLKLLLMFKMVLALTIVLLTAADI